LKVKPRACTGCKRCQEACPVGAIDLVPAPPGDRGQGKPAPLRVAAIDAQRCIKCYCCMELCPEAAITPRRGVFL
jgi:formate hydrogenlyase subunit 6/NADH:ubiquinone oxidoreductase subunit I